MCVRCVCVILFFHSYDDDERKQHYEEIKADLSVAEENLHSLVDGKVRRYVYLN